VFAFRILAVALAILINLPSARAADQPAATAVAADSDEPPPHMMGDGWVKAHEKHLEFAKSHKVCVAFIGDSLIAGWTSAPSWAKTWVPRDAGNFGIPADRTEHVLWRLKHGLLDAMDPEVVVLQVGTNDLKSGEIRRSAEETMNAIKAIVETIRTAKPKARIIVMAIFPRQPKYDWIDAVIRELNARLSQLQRDMENVLVVDIGIQFRCQNTEPCKVNLQNDMLHLKASGYDIWTQCIVDMVDAGLRSGSE
jgi:lysophospholipase L1-like esterase